MCSLLPSIVIPTIIPACCCFVLNRPSCACMPWALHTQQGCLFNYCNIRSITCQSLINPQTLYGPLVFGSPGSHKAPYGPPMAHLLSIYAPWPPMCSLWAIFAEVEKVKTLSGKLQFRSNTFCQIAYCQPCPDPLTIAFYCIFKWQCLKRCESIAHNIYLF